MVLTATYKTQPSGGKYTDLFDLAFTYAAFDRIDIAVAYATLQGILTVKDGIDKVCPWTTIKKRWVVGIDWRRSEPSALEYLAKLPKSQARIFDGLAVVSRNGCVPVVPFHPKVFILRSDNATAIVSGSANLSLNGQSRGHEVGSVVTATNVNDPANSKSVKSLKNVIAWFNRIWRQAEPVSTVLPFYKAQYETTEHLKSPVPTEDDHTVPVSRSRRALSEKQLRQLRACRHLWIEAGNLHANRGIGKPGNQLMLSPLTRVFFGFPPIEVPTDTFIGYVRIEFQGHERSDCSLRYSNNSMDVLGLPIPGIEGPLRYDGETLLFERAVDSFGVKYILRIGSAQDRQLWRRQSRRVSGDFKMTSGREWGVF